MSLVSLKTELRQELKLTPQLLQSMEVLQMTSQELLDYLNRFTGNYGVALILFAVLVQLVLLPITIKSKKSMMKMSYRLFCKTKREM